MTETKFTGTTPDITVQNIEALKSLFPEVCSDGKIDFEKLQQLLGKEVDTSPERYNFSWNGKSQALHLSQSPSAGTLIPCKEESRDFDSTQNLYIEGDNLEVLKLLQKPYHKAVKMIYIDPPYNTSSDFVYPDDYRDNLENYLELTEQVDSDGKKIGTNSESNGRYHTNWLNMMYPRLRLARNLLSDDGVIFISIDDHEQANLKKICDEVFGEDNFIADFLWKKKGTTSNVEGAQVSSLVDNTLCYRKTEYGVITSNIILKETRNYPGHDKDGNYRETVIEKKDSGNYRRDSMKFPILGHKPRVGKRWQIGEDSAKILEDNGRFYWDGEKIKLKIYDFEDKDTTSARSNLLFDVGSTDSATSTLNELLEYNDLFDNPKPVELLETLAKYVDTKNTLILDFFSGSATTAHAVMQLNADDIASGKQGNRKFIMVQLPEPCKADSEAFKAGYKTICEIGKERIRRAGDKIQKELEEKLKNASPDLFNQTTQAEPVLDTGFKVFKLASSNIKKWNPDYEHLDESLWQNVNSFVDGRTELDAVYEIMLKLGLELTCPVEEKELAGKKVYSVARGILIICLDKDITTDLAHAIVGLQKTTGVEEMRVVFKDAGFKDDVAKANCKEILKQGGIQEFVTI